MNDKEVGSLITALADLATDKSYSKVEDLVFTNAKTFENGASIAKNLEKPFKLIEVTLPIATWFASLSLSFEKWFAKILIDSKSY